MKITTQPTAPALLLIFSEGDVTYGLSIFNSSGTLVISEEYQNYHLVASGSLSNSGSLPSLVAGELLFVRPLGASGTVYLSHSGGSYIKSTTGTIQYAVVRERPPVTASAAGLLIKTSNGATAFDSNRRSLVPVALSRLAQADSGSSATISMPFSPLLGRTRYLCAASLRETGIAESGLGHFDYFRTTHVVWNSDNSMTLHEGLSYELAMAPPGTWFPMWGGLMFFSFADI